MQTTCIPCYNNFLMQKSFDALSHFTGAALEKAEVIVAEAAGLTALFAGSVDLLHLNADEMEAMGVDLSKPAGV